MIKMKRLHEKGEVATILAISAIIVIGISMIGSVFFGGKKQSTSSKANDVCDFYDNLTCSDLTCSSCTENSRGARCCKQVADTFAPTAEPQGAGLPAPDKTVTDIPATQATTAPTTVQATGDNICPRGNQACTNDCGGGNDCVKYLQSVTVPGVSDGGVINSDTFGCDIVTKNVAGANSDKDNICGIKVNDQWPAWCPWDGVGQYMCGSTITSHANCDLKSSHFSATPVKPGDKLQVVAARKTGSCGNIPWNTGGSFITGQTFYYKQKGAGGSTNTTPQATTAPQTPRATTAPQQPQPTTASQAGTTPKPTEQVGPGGATPAKEPSITPIVSAKDCNTALGPNKSLLVIPEGKTICIDTSLFGGTLGYALYKCNGGTPTNTTYNGSCAKCNATGDGCEVGSTGSTCIDTTCDDVCNQKYSVKSLKGSKTISYNGLITSSYTYFNGSQKCSDISSKIDEIKIGCGCTSNKNFTTVKVINGCNVPLNIDKFSYSTFLTIDTYYTNIATQLSPGANLMQGVYEACPESGAAWVKYTSTRTAGTDKYLAFPWNCNGTSEVTIGGIGNCPRI
ncbi:hypothetical protein HZC27_01590 [Candidatus Roizmanbacteria bacterium]|nr:hypothetical protein [Candidatus Roizmanbacteria bacterium]